MRAVITHLTSDEGKADLQGIGGVSRATAGVILCNLVTLQADDGDTFFGEPELDPTDLMRVVETRGVISLIELGASAARPALFSPFLMWLLAKLFEDLPEMGERDKPKLVFFCTQLPPDVPNPALSQLGARVQHSLRAFTPDDQKALSRTVKTYPRTEHYDLEQALTRPAPARRSSRC